MSGTGRPDFGSGTGSSGISCTDLTAQCVLGNLTIAVAIKIQVGAVLHVSRAPEGPGLIAQTKAGQIVGSIPVTNIGRFLSCMDEGHRYVAIVAEKMGNSFIKVDIRPHIQ